MSLVRYIHTMNANREKIETEFGTIDETEMFLLARLGREIFETDRLRACCWCGKLFYVLRTESQGCCKRHGGNLRMMKFRNRSKAEQPLMKAYKNLKEA